MRKNFVYSGFVSVFLLSAFFGVRAQGIHDVAIVSVTPSCPRLGIGICTEAYCTWIIDVYVDTRNEGDFSETFNVTAYYDNNTIGTKTITLDSGAGKTLVFEWVLTFLTPRRNYIISANASIVPSETDTDDNTYIDGTVKVKVLGDVTGDDFVDVDDLQKLGWFWQKGKGEIGYDPQADFSFDGLIDVDDLQMLGWNWHKL